MSRKVCFLIVGLLGTALASAQGLQGQPQRAQGRPPEPTGPQGEQKLRWVCRQLQLDATQMQQAEAFMAAYHAELKDMEENAAELLQRIQDKAAELQAARTAGDTEKTLRLQEELRNLAPAVQAENHFFEGLEQHLTAEQRTKLPQILKKAETAGDISLRPVHVLRAARKLGLSSEQNAQLEKLLDEYRTSAATARGEKPQAAEERVEQFIANVRAILNPDQVEAYDKTVAALRDDPPSPAPFEPPVAATPPTPE